MEEILAYNNAIKSKNFFQESLLTEISSYGTLLLPIYFNEIPKDFLVELLMKTMRFSRTMSDICNDDNNKSISEVIYCIRYVTQPS